MRGTPWLLLVAITSATQAQPPSRRLLTVGLGVVTRGPVWTLSPTYLPVNNSAVPDSLALSRARVSAYALTIGLTRFVRTALAWTVDVGYVAAPTQASCDSLGPWVPEAEELNRRACMNVNSRSQGGLLSAHGGLLVRPLSRSSASPYVRLAAGATLLHGQFIRTWAWVHSNSCGTCPLFLLDEARNSRLTWSGFVAVGLHVRPEGALGFRFEGRELVAWLPVPSGPPERTDPYLRAPVRKEARRLFMVMAGAEIDLERRHQRRY